MPCLVRMITSCSNRFGFMFDEISASSMVKVDLEGNIVEPLARRIHRAGFIIHSAVHAARPEVGRVIHSHTRGDGGIDDEVRAAAAVAACQSVLRTGKARWAGWSGRPCCANSTGSTRHIAPDRRFGRTAATDIPEAAGRCNLSVKRCDPVGRSQRLPAPTWPRRRRSRPGCADWPALPARTHARADWQDPSMRATHRSSHRDRGYQAPRSSR